MSDENRFYEVLEVGQTREVEVQIKSGWYPWGTPNVPDDGKKRWAHVKEDCLVTQLQTFSEDKEWVHKVYLLDTAKPLPPPPPSPPGLWDKLVAWWRGRRLPRAYALPAPERRVPSTLSEALDDGGGW